MRKVHPLHRIVADLFEHSLPEGCRLVRDEACGGDQRIPLFCSKEKSRTTWYCDVDMLIIKNGKIAIIVEIDESDIKPTQICGKFLTSALARYYIHESENDVPIEMHDSVTFIQIMDTSKLKRDKTSKFKQWNNLEKSIQAILPVTGNRIQRYRLFYGDEAYFESKKCSELIAYIKNA